MDMNDQSANERLKVLQQLNSLHTATTAIVSNLGQKRVLETVGREMTRILDARACIISEWERDKNVLRTISGFKPESGELFEGDMIEYPLAEDPVVHTVLESVEAIHLMAGRPKRISTKPGVANGIESLSRLLLPMVYQDQVVGLIEIHNKAEHSYSQQEIVLAKMFAILAAIAMENARLSETALHEIRQRERIEEKIQYDALHDPLTDLPNRELFLDRLKLAIARTKCGKGNIFAVLYIDVDKFKLVNDSLGHEQGDRVLVELSKILLDSVREVDTVCRCSGDEFLLLLDQISGLDEALTVVEYIHTKLQTPLSLGYRLVPISASIGIVMSSPEYEYPEEYIRDADIAIYHAKMNKKGSYQIFHPDIRNSLFKRLTLESELRRAIQEGEFSLHYQPIMSLDTNKITAFEALIRWQTYPLGTIYPNDFIPLAEETGLIVELGYWIIQEACEQILRWQKKFQHDPPLRISVNISGKQLNAKGFPERVEQILETVGLNPHSLILEITESVYIGETSRGGQALAKLRDLGIQVHLDDFGTGYSALSVINEFPVDAIKIARAFVTDFNPREQKRGLVHTIISMAQDFNLMVVAEGIETPEQALKLSAIGCQFGQGFSFTSGKDPDELETYIESHLN
jgi:diguanylate cyclase (GGDEF)-like protein